MTDPANDSQQNEQSPGWDAIDAALAPIYGDQEPKHYGTLISYELGGPDPLRGISAYRRRDPRPYWHFVTYGFSELFQKESKDLDVSGYGFELTFRLTDDGSAEEPPRWAIHFLQNLARYVFGSGNVFQAGHYMNLNGPIALETETNIRSIAFVRDPELRQIATPHGSLEFLQVLGLTDDEEFALKRWSTLKALEVFESSLPLYLTDLDRTSLLDDAAIAARIEAGSKEDGSNTGMVFTDQLSWTQRKRLLRKAQIEVTLGARQVDELIALLPLRLPFEREFMLIGREARIVFEPARSNRAQERDGDLVLGLDPATLQALTATLCARAGEYAVPGFDGLTLIVRKTEIRDGEGQVVEVFG
jgi:suppressor of fused